MQLQSHVGVILGEDLDAVDVAEVGQQGHEVGAGVDDVTDAVARAHQQRHLRLFLTLLRSVQAYSSERYVMSYKVSAVTQTRFTKV